MTVHVLHLIKGLGPGGAEQLLLNQARVRATNPSGAFTVAYLVPWKDHLVDPLEAAGWQARRLGGPRSIDVRWAWRLRRLIREQRVDVVHGHSPLVAAISRLVLRTIPSSRRPKSVYTEHNEWGRHNRWTRLLNRATIRLEDHVIAVSHGVRASMPARIEVEVLVHGIDLEAVASQRSHRAAVRQELGITDDELVIGIVANFRKEKAYEVLLQAAAVVIAKRPEIRFVSVGQGPLEGEIRAEHERLGLGDRFLILGYRDDATRIMSGFDVFTLASHHEGLPVSLMEATALGLPVVATAVGGIPEAAVGSAAVLVRPGDVAALAEAYLNIEAAGRVDASRFDMSVAAERLQDIYEDS